MASPFSRLHPQQTPSSVGAGSFTASELAVGSIQNVQGESPNSRGGGGTAPRVLRIGNYRLGKTIGVGSFGKVKLAEHVVTRHKVAVKILNRSKISTLRMDVKITREIANLKLFRHPHIIKLYEVIETPSDIFMVMEYVPGGELFDYIVSHGKLSEPEARGFFQQIVAAVDYCHSHMVVHRDLKPENLLISSRDNAVKIADFGLSTMFFDGDFLKTSCGSPNYAAPEVISGKLYAGPEVDVWSCGVILYTLVCARLPFDDDYIPALFKKIRAAQYAIPAYVSQPCADLIRKMLVVDPLERITMAEIKQHPWFVVDLPQYLAASSNSRVLDTDHLDEEVIAELAENWQRQSVQFHQPGVDVNTIRQALIDAAETNTINEYVVAYNLITDARDSLAHRRELESIAAHQSEFTSGSLPRGAELYATSPPVDMRTPMAVSYTDGRAQSSSASAAVVPASERPDEFHWHLGLTTGKEPMAVMSEICRAVVTLGLEWKLLNPWSVRVREVLDFDGVDMDGHPEDEDEVDPEMFAIQIFKVKEGKYLLDIKLIQGDTFVFFDLCSKMLDELQL